MQFKRPGQIRRAIIERILQLVAWSLPAAVTTLTVIAASWGNAVRDALSYLKEHEVPTGAIIQYTGITAPTGYLLTDGAAVSRTTYADLFAAITKTATVTITIASPGVLTWTAHGLSNGMPIRLTTTGALPTGLTAGTTYYIINATTNTFQLATQAGGTAINTSGTQSGTHTALCAPYGFGDGSTTFNLPNLNGKSPIGAGAAGTQVMNFVPGDVTTGTDTITVSSNQWLLTGRAVVLTTTGTAPTGLTASTTYYVIRTSATAIKLATSLANAQAGTAIDITGTGTGIHTLTATLTAKILGENSGAENITLSSNELPAHTHSVGSHTHGIHANTGTGSSTGVSASTGTAADTATFQTDAAGGTTTSTGTGAAFNLSDPTLGVNFIIKT